MPSSRQASSRKKLLDKITLDDIRPSSRKYPFIQFNAERALGKEVVHTLRDMPRDARVTARNKRRQAARR